MTLSMSNAAANALQAAFSIVLTFVLYRVVIASLGIDDLGVWSVLLATTAVSRLSDLGLTAGITRYIARDLASANSLHAAAVLETGVVALGLAVGAILGILYWLAPYLLAHAFDGRHLASALDILPYSLVSTWLSVVGMAAVGGLDGCQRFRIKAVVLVATQVLMVLLAIPLLHAIGLRGLAYAQVAQSTVLAVVAWAVLRRDLRDMPLFPHRCRWSVLREMLGYGVKVQASALSTLLFDPLTKFLMAGFGGPQAVGYFEVANQIITKVRAVILSANQVIVPRIAATGERNVRSIGALYASSLRLTVLVSVPTYALLLAALLLINALIFKSNPPEFAYFLAVCALGWAANTLAIPAFFVNLGTGAVDQNLLQQFLMAALNLVLGPILGAIFLARGVVVAYTITLVVGSVFLLGVHHRRLGIRLSDLRLRENVPLLATSLAVAVAGVLASQSAGDRALYWEGLLFGMTAALMMAVPAWRHPLRRELLVAVGIGGRAERQ